jgi:ankyrin repeat protein
VPKKKKEKGRDPIHHFFGARAIDVPMADEREMRTKKKGDRKKGKRGQRRTQTVGQNPGWVAIARVRVHALDAMLDDHPPHSFIMQTLPAALGNAIAYLLGWGRSRQRRAIAHTTGGVGGGGDSDGSDTDEEGSAGDASETRSGHERSPVGRDAVGRTALFRALARDRLDDADRFMGRIDNGTDFARLVTDALALSYAVTADRAASLMLLAKHADRVGTDLVAVLLDPRSCDRRPAGAKGSALGHGATLLHLACATDSVAALVAMLRIGAPPDAAAREGAPTPLHVAARMGSRACAGVLVARGASPDARGPDDTTPLHEAASHGRTAVARLLLACGAPTTARRRHDGATPAEAALRAGHTATAMAIAAHNTVRHR